MDVNKILNVINNPELKSNKDLFQVKTILEEEHEKTKDLIINLTRHLDSIEDLYDKLNKEIFKRTNKVNENN